MKVVTVDMYDNVFDERCPICGCILGYRINSYGKVVRSCSNCKYVIPDDPVITTNKIPITDFNKQSTYATSTPISNNPYTKDYGFGDIAVAEDSHHTFRACPDSDLKSNELSILCNLIKIKCGEIEINLDTNKDLKHIKSIVINGIRFNLVEE